MLKLRRLLSLLLLASLVGTASACSEITAWDEECEGGDLPGSNNRCDL